jgi:tetratricopeptide (TPR) repeat protein
MAPTREIEKLQRRWQENPLGLTFAPLAEAYRKEGMFADALELLDIGLSQHPNYVPAHIVRGRCFLDTGQQRDAEASFHRVTELDPDNVIALQELADIAERAGRFSEAEARLERLLDFDRSNDDARAQLERIKAELSIAMPEPSVARVTPIEPEPVIELEPEPVIEPEPTKAEIVMADVAVSAYQPVDLGVPPAPVPDLPNEEPPPEPVAAAEPSVSPEPRGIAPDEWPATEGTSLEVEPPVAEPASPFVTHESEPVFEPEEKVAAPGSFSPWPDQPVTIASEPDAGAEPEPTPAPPAGVVDEWLTDVSPEPVPEPAAPEPAPTPEATMVPPVEASPEPEPEVAEGSAELDEANPDLVVTETMAEIFLRQGHRELALAVYSQLLTRDPSNGRIRTAAERLESELRPAGGAPGLPAYAAVLTGGQSVRSFFETLLGSTRPGAVPSGGPLSLGAVFGDERTPAGVEAAAPAGDESFDEFFGGEPAPVPESLPSGPAQPTPDPVEDIEEFNSWLKGLKR